jgi:hypothetical protein
VAEIVARGGSAPGVWVEARSITHVFAYYLHDLGPWQQRDFASDGTVVKHLLTSGNYRPVLLSRERYDEVMTRIVRHRAELIDRLSQMTGLDPATLEQDARDTVLGIIEFHAEVLLLPGPFSGCAPVRTRLGSPPQP